MPQLKVIQPGTRGGLRSIALRVYRLAIVVMIVWIIHRHYARLRIDGDAPIRTDEVRAFFPTAARLAADESERLGLFVLDAGGRQIGYVLRTSPLSDRITGYSGPTDTLIALNDQMKVVGIRIRSSWDTKEHVRDVGNDAYFMKTWNGKTWDEVAGMDPKSAHIEGVSGASLTSLAIAHGIQQRFRRATTGTALPKPRLAARDVGLIVAVAVAMIFSFTDLRGRPWLRRAFQIGLIGYVGFWNGQLIAQSLLTGWAASEVPWRLAPGLTLLVAAALVVPWSTRRALYCSQICPHGAAQELMGRITRRKFIIPSALERGLRWLPALLVALVLTVTMLNLPLNLAAIEPFDAYLIRAAGVATIVIAATGLLAAIFVPMAYCKYGCPTGLVLSFVRSHGKADRFGRRDFAAGALVLMVVFLYVRYDAIHHWILR